MAALSSKATGRLVVLCGRLGGRFAPLQGDWSLGRYGRVTQGKVVDLMVALFVSSYGRYLSEHMIIMIIDDVGMSTHLDGRLTGRFEVRHVCLVVA